MKLPQNFIPLALKFDAEQLAEEVRALPDSAWIPHPLGLNGNSAVPLISVGGGINDLFQGAMGMTPYLEQSPYHRQVLASFKEVLGRSRLMRISAGTELTSHVDVEYHWFTRVRIHIPVITNPDVVFNCAGETMHMPAGSCWIFNTWLPHKVDNNGAEDRIHLVIDVCGSSRFWNLVRKSLGADPNIDLASQGIRPRRITYRKGSVPLIRTEQFNVSPVLAPGEMESLVGNIIRDISSNPRNDPDTVEYCRVLITKYAMDWRQIWLAFGFLREGWPHYDSLVRTLMGEIENRALENVVMFSNNTPVTEVIRKHLIVPSMNVDFLEALNNPPSAA